MDSDRNSAVVSKTDSTKNSTPMTSSGTNTVAVYGDPKTDLGPTVKLVFNEDEHDPVEYGADWPLLNSGITDVAKKDGGRPRGRNMRVLLDCDGGTLQFEGETYGIVVPIQKEDCK